MSKHKFLFRHSSLQLAPHNFLQQQVVDEDIQKPVTGDSEKRQDDRQTTDTRAQRYDIPLFGHDDIRSSTFQGGRRGLSADSETDAFAISNSINPVQPSDSSFPLETVWSGHLEGEAYELAPLVPGVSDSASRYFETEVTRVITSQNFGGTYSEREERLEPVVLTPTLTIEYSTCSDSIGLPHLNNQTSVIRKNHLARVPAETWSYEPEEQVSNDETAKVSSREPASPPICVELPLQPVCKTSEAVTCEAKGVARAKNPNILFYRGEAAPYKCKVCQRRFRSKNNFKYHLHDTSTTTFPYKCEICGKGMFASTHYRYHVLTHSGERSHKCSVCSKGFLTALKLKRHMIIHTEEKTHGCNQCSRKFYTAKDLHRHIKAIHEELIRSGHHGNRLSGQDDLLGQPVSCHVKKVEYPCSVCGRVFQRRKHLETHSSVHTGKKPFKCEKCGKAFRTEASHLHHMKTHSGERPYVCPVCGRGFVLKKDCQRHQGVHIDESPFTCDLCDKTFRRQDNRDRHVKIYHLEGKRLGIE